MADTNFICFWDKESRSILEERSLLPRAKFHFNFKYLAQEYVDGEENIPLFWNKYVT